MKLKHAILPLVLAAVAGSIDTADAGGMKGQPVPAIAVPAPIPITDYMPRWYFRADLGIGMASEPDVTVSGPALLGSADVGGTTVPIGSSWFRKDFDTFTTYGLGVGYIWSPRWRSDVTLDVRSRAYIKSDAAYNFDSAGGVAESGTYRDTSRVSSVVTLFNTYYDFQRFSRFTPYIGFGLGFSSNEIERSNTVTQSDGRSSSTRGKNHDISLAAAATAGVSYAFDDMMSLDLNYRYFYVGGAESSVDVLGRPNGVSFGDIHEHQLRAGVRFNVN